MSFKDTYKESINNLKNELGIKNVMELPKLEKIVLNMWIGTYVRNGNKDFSSLKSDLALIAWQNVTVRNSKKAISNFKLKENQPVGLTVTLRGDRMFYFLEKMIQVILPRVRDFRWLSSKSFDKEWNYNFGIKEHTIFPEVPQHDVVKPHGVQVTLKFKSKSKDHSKALLEALGFPFSK